MKSKELTTKDTKSTKEELRFSVLSIFLRALRG
jgi:hypothetical protein